MIHQIDHGELKINNQTLIISDNAKTAHIIPLFLSIALIIQSAASITKWIVDGQITDAFDYIYIPVFLIGIGLFIHQMRFNTLRDTSSTSLMGPLISLAAQSLVILWTNVVLPLPGRPSIRRSDPLFSPSKIFLYSIFSL